jgi:hypothetical protein
MSSTYKFNGKGKTPFGRTRCRSKDVKMDLRNSVRMWTGQAPVAALVNTELNLRAP